MKVLSDAELLMCAGVGLLIVGVGLLWGWRAVGLSALIVGAVLGLVGLAGVLLEVRAQRASGGRR